jgi:hypothetical protein
MSGSVHNGTYRGICSRCHRRNVWNMVGRWCRPCYHWVIEDNPRWEAPADPARRLRIETYAQRAGAGLPLLG